MPEIHLRIFFIEDCILYNLPNIKWNVLDDGIVEQGPLGRHFKQISRRDEKRCDEVMPYLRNVGQVFSLEVHFMPFTVQFPLTLPVGQHPKDFGIVGMLMEPIIVLEVNWLEVIVSVDRLHTEVYHNPAHPDPFQHVGGEIGIELSYHTRGNRSRRLEKRPPSLIRNGFAKEIIGVVKPLLLDEKPILRDEAEFLDLTLIDKFLMIVIMSGLFTCPTSFLAQFQLFA